MLAWEYIEYFTVYRRSNFAVIGQEGKAVTCHFLREDSVRNLRDIKQLAVNRRNNVLWNDRCSLFACCFFKLRLRGSRGRRRCSAVHNILNLRFNGIGTSSENRLNVVSDFKHPGSAQFLQTVLIDTRFILNLNPETGDAGIQMRDVLFAA
ncbi:hypothetical protein D3C75_963670 [compost metagenome]